ncbi:MAG: SUF system NifU family Fe-S cluster assembly protein [Gammaproteobacteria bacterium]|nr:SUF system NifU family Fe-S cluster assembly protein [Gammaproteobacteria bacterium]MYF66867.1 SUF system NifU family Fe-S cluster assembly protein [Gammaproteobacteria bacterium]MYK36299.1 SUF system NifU family Fe-S cluster assembly protein [Gammaproteobacteria bacterium]
MSSKLQNLYQRTVLEHCRSPRNFHAMDEPDRVAEGFNPLCGDKVTVYLRTPGTEGLRRGGEDVPSSNEGETPSLPFHIAEISFEAAGCAICLASASMMTELLDGETADHAKQQAEKVLEAFKPGVENGLGDLGEIVALGSVRSYPSRIRCVTLPWKTFTAALDGDPNTVSTE